MGAEPWSCSVPYRDHLAEALRQSQEEEFRAGRYRQPMDGEAPPATIHEAILRCDASGTGSILDMIGVTEEPHDPGAEMSHFGMVAPLSAQQLVALFGTDKPTRDRVEQNHGFYEGIDRGLGIYIVVYDGDAPSEIFFAGYSFD